MQLPKKVKYFFHLILFFILSAESVFAQTPVDTFLSPVEDSILQRDSILIKDTLLSTSRIDSFSKRPKLDTVWVMSPGISFSSPRFSWEVVKHHPYFGFNTKPVTLPESDLRKINGKELMFYLLVLLLIVFALLKRLFPKYFEDLFRLFFRTTLKQRQIREQLLQMPLPSLMLNGFFEIGRAHV